MNSLELKKTFELQSTWRWQAKINTLEQRLSALNQLRSTILKYETEIFEALRQDLGKPLAEAFVSEIFTTLGEIKNIKKNLKKWSKPQNVSGGVLLFGTKSQIRREARGTVLVISPWNYPFCLAMVPAISAIAAGNTVIIKPSELTPQTSLIIQKIISEVFEPRWAAVALGGKETSEELLKLPFDHIFFTGSTQVGKIVMTAAAKNLSSVTLELGGKSPTLVHSSCDLKLAADKIAWGKFVNSGQTCIAPDYILVDRQVADEFKTLLQAAIENQLHGRINTEIVTERHRDRLLNLVEQTVANGARTLTPATKIDSRSMTPVLIENPQLTDSVMTEEIFGPVLPIIEVQNLDESIQFIRSRPKPLSLYLFAKDAEVIAKVLSETSSGGVCINDNLIQFANHHLPFGGIGASGMGNYHGEAGFKTLTHEKAVLTQGAFSRFSSVIYPPYSDKRSQLVRRVLHWFC